MSYKSDQKHRNSLPIVLRMRSYEVKQQRENEKYLSFAVAPLAHAGEGATTPRQDAGEPSSC